MATCDTKTYTNIKELPQIFNVTSGDFLIVENPQGTNIIDYKDVILPIEQTTFAGVLSTYATNISNLSSELAKINNDVLPGIMNVRMSLSPDTPTPTSNLSGVNASVLYVHPYKGDIVTLYNTSLSAWRTHVFNTRISQSLTNICTTPNTNYDIYLSISSGGEFNITAETLPSTFGNINLNIYRKYLNGIAVNPKDYSKRLIGCIRSDEVAGRSIQTFGGRLSGGFHCKQYVWNAQNQIPINCWGFDSGTYYAQAPGEGGWTGWRKVNPVVANNPTVPSTQRHRFSFIVGDYTAVNLTGQIYASYYSNLTLPISYTAVAIDTEDNSPTLDAGTMVSELRGSDMTPRSQTLHSFQPGAHFIQLLENIATANQLIIMNESHGNQTGYIVTLNM